ncbi:hypothetical protein [Anaerobiospirillum succiniciproducens]|uniref:hypothetical protein n=1 Tax=Anaerobiospirillum succiniciproducens TaxID=13335 RepID=UPI00048449BF|nr:hypothetical protein [Anaerobiospirillum succiniciproducens]
MLLFIELNGAVAFCVCFCFARAFLSCFCFVALLLICWFCFVAFGAAVLACGCGAWGFALQVGELVVGGLKGQRAAKVEFYLGYPLQITDGDDLD